MPDPISGFVTVTTIAGGIKTSLEALEKVRDKLISQPDPAAERLVSVMAKLEAMFIAMDEELTNYVGLDFWEGMDRKDYAQVYADLNRLMPEVLQARFRSTKASCTTIQNIYQAFLQGWFSRILDPGEQRELKILFELRLGLGDETFVEMLDNVAYQLGASAIRIKDLLDSELWQEAIDFHRAERKQVNLWRRNLALVWRDIADLRDQVQLATGATVI